MPTFVYLAPNLQHDTDVPSESGVPARYNYEDGRQTLDRLLAYDEGAHYACVVPQYPMAGRQFRVRVTGLQLSSETDEEVLFALGRYYDGDGFSITLDAASYSRTIYTTGGDTDWISFPEASNGFSLLGVYCFLPSWGGQIEWQVWQQPPKVPARKVMVRASRDGGITWGAWRESSLGALGQYQHRVRFRRFGRGSQFCFQVRVTSPLVLDHLGGGADMEVGG